MGYEYKYDRVLLGPHLIRVNICLTLGLYPVPNNATPPAVSTFTNLLDNNIMSTLQTMLLSLNDSLEMKLDIDVLASSFDLLRLTAHAVIASYEIPVSLSSSKTLLYN